MDKEQGIMNTAKLTPEEVHLRACQALVSLFRDQVESNIECVHSRIFNYVLHPEQRYVHCAHSEAVKEGVKTHPEHVVPCALMIRECFSFIKEGKYSDDEIAGFLQQHWKIVTITKEEAKRLDSELRLKSTMPEGWHLDSEDTFARFKKANIKVVKSI